MKKIELVTAHISQLLADSIQFWIARGDFGDAVISHQNEQDTSRQTIEYGYSYHAMVKDPQAEPTDIPVILQSLYWSAIAALQESSDENLNLSKDFNNCIISIFGPGDKLRPHVDVDETRTHTSKGDPVHFYYDKDVVGIIIQADSTGQLYLVDQREEGEENPDAIYLPEEDGFVYLMTGESRFVPYAHGVSEVTDQRISITFRTMHKRFGHKRLG